MIPLHEATDWQTYRSKELAKIVPILAQLGFELEANQIHIGGERSVISGYKLVLLGERLSDKKRVVIKVSSHPQGKEELRHARRCQTLLNEIHFAHRLFLSPTELIWQEENGCVVSITEFIEQAQPFLERSFEDQFFLALKTFELQESAHATTYEHARAIRNTFGIWDESTYQTTIDRYGQEIKALVPHEQQVQNIVSRAATLFAGKPEPVRQYLGFLTHTDFVPHNIRVVGHDIYLLDHSAIRFGNKYDGWARFLNFMLLHHRDLETALLTYVKANRSPEESEALRHLRIFRLTELIWYYVQRLSKTAGSLHELDQARVFFWTDALEALLDDRPLPDTRIQQYQKLRDSLRSDEEKQRQKGLH